MKPYIIEGCPARYYIGGKVKPFIGEGYADWRGIGSVGLHQRGGA